MTHTAGDAISQGWSHLLRGEVCFGSEADIERIAANVCFEPEGTSSLSRRMSGQQLTSRVGLEFQRTWGRGASAPAGVTCHSKRCYCSAAS